MVTNEVIPLPPLRAEAMLKDAEKLAEKKARTVKENETLAKFLAGARDQLTLAETLTYGNRKSFKPMYEEIEKIEKQSANDKNENGFFDKIKNKISALVK